MGLLIIAVGVLCANCADCRGAGDLSVHGPTPYVRCLAADPAADLNWKLGEVSFQRSGRSLAITGLPDDVRIVAFEGPSLTAGPTALAIAAVAEQKPHLALLVGGIGDDARAAKATLSALGAAAFPTLVLSGGRDAFEDVAAAFDSLSGEAAERVISIDALRTIRIGTNVLVPIPGAADGRYARTDGSCGFGLSDLQTASGVVGVPVDGERRWLVSWNAPGRGGEVAAARTVEGIDLGSEPLAEFASRVGAPGGIHAWPRVRPSGAVAGQGAHRLEAGTVAVDAQLTVPVLGGPPVEDTAGGMADPGFALVSLGPGGLGVQGVFSRQPTRATVAPPRSVSGDGGVPN